MKNTLRVFGLLDREFLLWGATPCLFATLVVCLFALPNYMRANTMQSDAQRLKAVTDETITAQNNLRNLQQIITELRQERDRRCRPLGDGAERDRLLSAITRLADGSIVRDQSIRTGGVMPPTGAIAELPVSSREVTVDMSGTFDAIFGVIDAAESVDQLVTPRSIEITILATPAEQAETGTASVRAQMIFDEWFQARAVVAQPTQGTPSTNTAAPSKAGAAPAAPAKSGGTK